MAKEKLIPERPDSDRRDPHKRFSDFAAKIVTVPKSEIDEREKQWKEKKTGGATAPKRGRRKQT